MRRTTTGRCRIWVRLRRTRPEQMSSGSPLKADIAQYGQHLSKVPIVLQKSQTTLRDETSDNRRSICPQKMALVQANVFRVTPESGHCSIRSASLKGAYSVAKVPNYLARRNKRQSPIDMSSKNGPSSNSGGDTFSTLAMPPAPLPGHCHRAMPMPLASHPWPVRV